VINIKATAIAHPNFALVKYWGKRDELLKLPTVSSLSLTIDNLYTQATIEFSKDLDEDNYIINGKVVTGGKQLERLSNHLNLIRDVVSGDCNKGIIARVIGKDKKCNKDMAKLNAKVIIENNFPHALTNSSSNFTALTLAAWKALGMEMEKKEISKIARQGSGTACRSVFGGMVEWSKGSKKDGSDSYASQIHDHKHWAEIRTIMLILDPKDKKIKGGEGMKISKESSPFYEQWIKESEKDLKDIKMAIKQKDFSRFGKVMESNCLRMHSLMISSTPSLIYLKPETLVMIEKIKSLRENNLECYFTIDAGANIMLLCLEKNVEKIIESMEGIPFIHDFIICSSGEDAKLYDEHLF
jgi:diphosphomevalonate decarboxylase